MDVFDLVATIRLNADAFNQGLDAAKTKAKSFASGLESTSSGIGGVKDVLSTAAQGFQKVESVGKTAGKAIMTGLKGFTAASAVVGAFGKSAVNSGMEFDATMSEVSAISGAVSQDFQDLRDKALEMGAKTKFSASEAGEAMTYMAMAGWKTQDMLGGIEGIMNLAAASGEDLATTSDIVTDALTAFGKSASDSGRLADIMAAASSNANTNVSMLGESFKYVAPVAGALGYTMEDTSLMLGLMANSGIKASQAGTSLRSIMTRLAKPTKESGTAMDMLGISLTNADGSMKSLTEVVEDMRTGFSGLSEAQQAEYAAMLAGKEAMSGLLAIVNAAPEDVDKLTEALDNCNGAAEKMAATMIDNLQGDLTLLGSAFESLKIAISDGLTPTLREFAQFGQKAMAEMLEGFQGGGVTGLMTAFQGIVTDGVKMLSAKAPEFASVTLKFIEALVSGILGARAQIFEAGNKILVLLSEGISNWLSSHSGELIEFGNGILQLIFQGFLTVGNIISENIGQFIPLIVNAFASYHEMLFTVGMDILGAIGQGIVDNKDSIQSIASDSISSMVTAFRDNAPAIIDGALALLDALVGAILDNLPLIADTAVEIIAHLASGIGNALPALIPAAVEAIITFAENLTSPSNISLLINGALDIINGLVEGILKALPKLVAAAPVIIINLVTGLIASLPKIFEAAVEIVLALAEGLISAIPELVKAVPQIIMALVDAIVAFVVNFVEAGADLIIALGEGISGSWGDIVSFFVDAVTGIIDLLTHTWETVKQGAIASWEAIKGVFVAAWDGIKAVWSAVEPFFSGVWEGIKNVFSAVTETLSGFFSRAWDAIKTAWGATKEFFSGVWEGIKGVFSTVAEVLGGFFESAWEAIKAVWETAGEFFSGIGEGIRSVFEGVTEAISGFFSAAWDAIQNIWNGAVSFFQGVWAGISGAFSGVASFFIGVFTEAWNGIKSVWDGVKTFFSGVWSDIKGVFSGAWQHFKSIGSDIVNGIKQGISGAWGALSKWVSDKFKALVSGVKNLLGIKSPSRVFASIGGNMALGVGVGWDDEYDSIKKQIESGLNFETATVGLSASGLRAGNSNFGSSDGKWGGLQGGNTFNVTINSPKAMNAVEAAREFKKSAQMIAMGYV